MWSPRADCPHAPCPQPPPGCFQSLGHGIAAPTFFLMIPVSPLSRRLDSFSSRSFLSYLVLMSWISLSSSSSICFLVSSNSRSCCRTSSCAWLRVGKGEKMCAEGRGYEAAVLRVWDHKRTEAFLMKDESNHRNGSQGPVLSPVYPGQASGSSFHLFLLPTTLNPACPVLSLFFWARVSLCSFLAVQELCRPG